MRVAKAEHVVVAVAVAALVALHAFQNGAYDVVVRAELGIAVWWTLLVGVVSGVLPRARLGGTARACLLALALVGAVTALSLQWTSSAERTGIELTRVVAHLGILALVVALLRRETVGAVAVGLAVAMTAVLAAALAVRLAPGAFADPARVAFGTDRLSAPLNYWNGVAAWGAMGTALLLGLASSAGPRWRALAVAFVPLSVAVTYLTYSRAGVIGTALALLVLLLVSRRRLALLVNLVLAGAGAAAAVLAIRATPAIAEGTGGTGGLTVAAVVVGAGLLAAGVSVLATPRLPAVRVANARLRTGLLVVGLAAVALAATLTGPDLATRAYESFDQEAPRGSEADPAARLGGLGGNRRQLFGAAIEAGRTEPARGIGGGTFEFFWNQDARDPEYLRDAHSLYLETWAEYGIVGSAALALLALAVLAAMAQARRRCPDDAVVGLIALVVVYAFHAGVDWMWELSAVTVVALVAVGALASGARVADAAPRRRWVGRGALAVVAVAAVAVQLPAAVSLSDVRRSQAAVRAGDLREARVQADDAVAASPWAASPLVQRALVSEAGGQLAAADADLRRATEREPQDWRVPLVHARVLARLGRPRQAIERFERARRLRPLGAATRIGRG